MITINIQAIRRVQTGFNDNHNIYMMTLHKNFKFQELVSNSSSIPVMAAATFTAVPI
ncbi:GH12955 [Drosophila grimshawi]|uniref:GH12955 n=1 Tax=Drosophila grimshawi TaxID=7222 RepID=B4K445_DROGR|nr:GH12955 [Drosophila grimshawi]